MQQDVGNIRTSGFSSWNIDDEEFLNPSNNKENEESKGLKKKSSSRENLLLTLRS